GEVMYVPRAFTAEGLAAIRDRVASEERIEIGQHDASRLAANAVCLGDTLVMAACGARLRRQLEERGYRIVITPLTAYRRRGGAVFCLTLRLDHRSAAPSAPAQVTAA